MLYTTSGCRGGVGPPWAYVLLTLLNLLSLALCVSELPHTRLPADLFFCLYPKTTFLCLLFESSTNYITDWLRFAE